jgi:hypothetical protein
MTWTSNIGYTSCTTPVHRVNIHYPVSIIDYPDHFLCTCLEEMEEKQTLVVDVAEERQPPVADHKIWRSCCLDMDSEVCIFGSRLLISLATIIFCFIMLWQSESCERDSLYSGIVSMILGTYLANARIAQRNS